MSALPHSGFHRRVGPLPVEVKRAVKSRDGNRCVDCGASEQLTIHHIRPLSAGGEAMDLRNMETLCKPCHAARHGQLWKGDA